MSVAEIALVGANLVTAALLALSIRANRRWLAHLRGAHHCRTALAKDGNKDPWQGVGPRTSTRGAIPVDG